MMVMTGRRGRKEEEKDDNRDTDLYFWFPTSDKPY